MPTIGTATELIETLRQCRLLEPAQLKDIERRSQGKPVDVRSLSKELIKSGWLTPYQVNQVLKGRGHELLLGSYVLLERLGEGGMGAVYKARNWKIGTIVALKLIRKERIAHPNAVKRFHREIQAAAKLNHQNIVQALDAGEVNGIHFMTMEYVEGTDLHRQVKENGPLPIEQACEYIRQVALGLHHAHEQQMVHRDIKPHNLLVQRAQSGQIIVKLLDMGLARVVRPDLDGESSESRLTQEGSVLGTPDYIAPEQARGSHEVDIRGDLYSLGCTFYFLLTGQPPFPGGALGEKLLKHQLDEPTPVEKLRPEVPRNVTAIVRRLLSKKPQDRYQTPAELVKALSSAPKPGTAIGKNWLSLLTERRRRYMIAAGIAAGVLALLVAVMNLVFPGGDPPVDLLSLVDPDQHAVSGKWSFEGNTLVGSGRIAVLQIPYHPPEEYTLRVIAECKEPSPGFSIGLVSPAGELFQAVVDCEGKPICGLQTVDGQTVIDNETTIRAQVFEPDQQVEMICVVHKKGVTVTCNGRSIVNWQGDPSRLSRWRAWKAPDPQALFIGIWSGTYYIHKLELEPISGQGTVVSGTKPGTGP